MSQGFNSNVLRHKQYQEQSADQVFFFQISQNLVGKELQSRFLIRLKENINLLLIIYTSYVDTSLQFITINRIQMDLPTWQNSPKLTDTLISINSFFDNPFFYVSFQNVHISYLDCKDIYCKDLLPLRIRTPTAKG